MELIPPSARYKDSFIEAVKEFRSESATSMRHHFYEKLATHELEGNFDSYVERCRESAEGKNLPKGYVPETEYWLVEGREFIGRINIRHMLNQHLLEIGGHIGYDIRPSERGKGYGKKILALALPNAKELGIDRVLVTCDETNVGSRKIIEANRGVFEDKRPNPEGGPDKLRFWLQL